MTTRADLLLVERGLAASRTAAQHLIEAGRVFVLDVGRRVAVSKASQKLFADVEFDIVPDEADRYVSRGGLKMAGALERAGLDVAGLTVLDLGISTGGFTDCLLQAGAAKVIGVDVGHSQLAPKLAADPRVVLLEGVNARHLHADDIAEHTGAAGVDLVVIDVSFISLELVLPAAAALIRPGGHLLSLVKPQFEVGREGLGKGGIVKNERLYDTVRDKIVALCERLELQVLDYFNSPIKGGDGNREFFVFARRAASA